MIGPLDIPIGVPDALLSLRPGAQWVCTSEGEITWLSDGKPPTPDEIAAEVDRLTAEASNAVD